ncbi:hypothetical protein SUDANB120_02606 [Streptomyces sp. enrichment culture]|uniref:DUF6299 family protein n=1 Tax=Streptomyces sp. enrichment culture TaxID=1795815 RepID=UPI003F57AE50
MSIRRTRMPLTVLAALAAATAFATPAGATVYEQEISVRPWAQLAADGTITLSGSYKCSTASPSGAMQISATVVQEGTRLTTTAEESPVCDGTEREWRGTAGTPQSLGLPGGIHEGEALFEARLQEIGFSGASLLPSSVDAVAVDSRPGHVGG